MAYGGTCPDAPVFYPSKREFADPLAYIRSIRNEGAKYGIARIVPPPDWKPPFALDMNKFRFKTRIQRVDKLQLRGMESRAEFYRRLSLRLRKLKRHASSDSSAAAAAAAAPFQWIALSKLDDILSAPPTRVRTSAAGAATESKRQRSGSGSKSADSDSVIHPPAIRYRSQAHEMSAILDLYPFYYAVSIRGGVSQVDSKRLWHEIASALRLPQSTDGGATGVTAETLRPVWDRYLSEFWATESARPFTSPATGTATAAGAIDSGTAIDAIERERIRAAELEAVRVRERESLLNSARQSLSSVAPATTAVTAATAAAAATSDLAAATPTKKRKAGTSPATATTATAPLAAADVKTPLATAEAAAVTGGKKLKVETNAAASSSSASSSSASTPVQPTAGGSASVSASAGSGNKTSVRPGFCYVCEETDQVTNLMRCRHCKRGFHPPCADETEKELFNPFWFCPECHPHEPFGFLDGSEYSLNEFKDKADSWKRDWFLSHPPASTATAATPAATASGSSSNGGSGVTVESKSAEAPMNGSVQVESSAAAPLPASSHASSTYYRDSAVFTNKWDQADTFAPPTDSSSDSDSERSSERKKPAIAVTVRDVEREFWRIVETGNDALFQPTAQTGESGSDSDSDDKRRTKKRTAKPTAPVDADATESEDDAPASDASDDDATESDDSRSGNKKKSKKQKTGNSKSTKSKSKSKSKKSAAADSDGASNSDSDKPAAAPRRVAVRVEYGADLDTSVTGSGFPRRGPYARSAWNLTNLPKVDNSVLKHLNNISGITIPWFYVGMTFSSFSWHFEDHAAYSINYVHLGGNKQWYGVPASAVSLFEAVFHASMPNLFTSQPDLLFGMVTMLSPRVLQAYGVPVYTTVQEAGEFVITFPQSYHAGFNHGFNCAEAVNFGPSDWLGYGVRGMERYRQFHRTPVFSHDMLLVRLAQDAGIVPPVLWQSASSAKQSSSAAAAAAAAAAMSTELAVAASSSDPVPPASSPPAPSGVAAAERSLVAGAALIGDSESVSSETHTLLWMKDGLVRLRDEERALRYHILSIGVRRARFWKEDTDIDTRQMREAATAGDADDDAPATAAVAKDEKKKAAPKVEPTRRSNRKSVSDSKTGAAADAKSSGSGTAKRKRAARGRPARPASNSAPVAAPPPSSAFGTTPGQFDDEKADALAGARTAEEFKYAKERYKPRTRSKLPECAICRHALYVSCVICTRCSSTSASAQSADSKAEAEVIETSGGRRLSCLRHSTEMCGCAAAHKQLLFRHSLEDLDELVDRVTRSVQSLTEMAASVAASAGGAAAAASKLEANSASIKLEDMSVQSPAHMLDIADSAHVQQPRTPIKAERFFTAVQSPASASASTSAAAAASAFALRISRMQKARRLPPLNEIIDIGAENYWVLAPTTLSSLGVQHSPPAATAHAEWLARAQAWIDSVRLATGQSFDDDSYLLTATTASAVGGTESASAAASESAAAMSDDTPSDSKQADESRSSSLVARLRGRKAVGLVARSPDASSRRPLTMPQIDSFMESAGEFIWSDSTPIIRLVRRAYEQLQLWRALTCRLSALSSALTATVANRKLTLSAAKEIAAEEEFCPVAVASERVKQLQAVIVTAEQLQSTVSAVLSRAPTPLSAAASPSLSLDEVLAADCKTCLTFEQLCALHERVKASTLVLPAANRISGLIKRCRVWIEKARGLTVPRSQQNEFAAELAKRLRVANSDNSSGSGVLADDSATANTAAAVVRVGSAWGLRPNMKAGCLRLDEALALRREANELPVQFADAQLPALNAAIDAAQSFIAAVRGTSVGTAATAEAGMTDAADGAAVAPVQTQLLAVDQLHALERRALELALQTREAVRVYRVVDLLTDWRSRVQRAQTFLSRSLNTSPLPKPSEPPTLPPRRIQSSVADSDSAASGAVAPAPVRKRRRGRLPNSVKAAAASMSDEPTATASASAPVSSGSTDSKSASSTAAAVSVSATVFDIDHELTALYDLYDELGLSGLREKSALDSTDAIRRWYRTVLCSVRPQFFRLLPRASAAAGDTKSDSKSVAATAAVTDSANTEIDWKPVPLTLTEVRALIAAASDLPSVEPLTTANCELLRVLHRTVELVEREIAAPVLQLSRVAVTSSAAAAGDSNRVRWPLRAVSDLLRATDSLPLAVSLNAEFDAIQTAWKDANRLRLQIRAVTPQRLWTVECDPVPQPDPTVDTREPVLADALPVPLPVPASIPAVPLPMPLPVPASPAAAGSYPPPLPPLPTSPYHANTPLLPPLPPVPTPAVPSLPALPPLPPSPSPSPAAAPSAGGDTATAATATPPANGAKAGRRKSSAGAASTPRSSRAPKPNAKFQGGATPADLLAAARGKVVSTDSPAAAAPAVSTKKQSRKSDAASAEAVVLPRLDAATERQLRALFRVFLAADSESSDHHRASIRHLNSLLKRARDCLIDIPERTILVAHIQKAEQFIHRLPTLAMQWVSLTTSAAASGAAATASIPIPSASSRSGAAPPLSLLLLPPLPALPPIPIASLSASSSSAAAAAALPLPPAFGGGGAENESSLLAGAWSHLSAFSTAADDCLCTIPSSRGASCVWFALISAIEHTVIDADQIGLSPTAEPAVAALHVRLWTATVSRARHRPSKTPFVLLHALAAIVPDLLPPAERDLLCPPLQGIDALKDATAAAEAKWLSGVVITGCTWMREALTACAAVSAATAAGPKWLASIKSLIARGQKLPAVPPSDVYRRLLSVQSELETRVNPRASAASVPLLPSNFSRAVQSAGGLRTIKELKAAVEAVRSDARGRTVAAPAELGDVSVLVAGARALWNGADRLFYPRPSTLALDDLFRSMTAAASHVTTLLSGSNPGASAVATSEAAANQWLDRCLCRGPSDNDGMIACDSCERWFHFPCVGIKNPKKFGGTATYMCPICCAAKALPYTLGAAGDDAANAEAGSGLLLTTARAPFPALTRLLDAFDAVARIAPTVKVRVAEVETCRAAVAALRVFLSAIESVVRTLSASSASSDPASLPAGFMSGVNSLLVYTPLIAIDSPLLSAFEHCVWFERVNQYCRSNRSIKLSELKTFYRNRPTDPPAADEKAAPTAASNGAAAAASAPASTVAVIPAVVSATSDWLERTIRDSDEVVKLIEKAVKNRWTAQVMADHSLISRYAALQASAIQRWPLPQTATASAAVIRLHVHDKQSIVDEASVITCSCGHYADDTLMIACDLCETWFHSRCVQQLASNAAAPAKFTSAERRALAKRTFVCHACTTGGAAAKPAAAKS